jgi:protein Mpv17
MAPLQLEWFQFLSEQFPITATNKTSAAIWRVLCDQIIFSPIGEDWPHLVEISDAYVS